MVIIAIRMNWSIHLQWSNGVDVQILANCSWIICDSKCHFPAVLFWPSIPDESSVSDERSSSPSLEERDSGLFLLRKDSERRAILYKILREKQNQVASNLQECVAQVITLLRILFLINVLLTFDRKWKLNF